MPLSSLSFSLFRLLLLPTLLSLLWLYLYPPIHGCAFPPVNPFHGGAQPATDTSKPAIVDELAPFRLLVLADPQLEGDTSLPDPNAPVFPSLTRWTIGIQEHGLNTAWASVRPAMKDMITGDLPRALQGYRKRLDLFGNDCYLAHIYRSVRWWTNPTHTVVLGDLLGSQWIGQEEFERRAHRFWTRVFAGAAAVPTSVTDSVNGAENLGADKSWARRVITVAGNHDIGYAGDIDSDRIERFERHFGRVNWEVRFQLNDSSSSGQPSSLSANQVTPELRLIVLNSMNLDEPASQPDLREHTWQFLENRFIDIKSRASTRSGTILLTHVPLHKEAGVCVDAPLVNLFPPEYGGGIREQNHLRPETSQHILDGLLKQSIILNGHDHEGCNVLHFKEDSTGETDGSADTQGLWTAKRLGSVDLESSKATPNSIREITVRSMMGSYDGNAGFLAAWFDHDNEQWRFEYSSCRLGVQHFWWAVHVLALVELGLLVVGTTVSLRRREVKESPKPKLE